MGDQLFAHGIGGAKDLPIPLELAIAGAVAALVISFTVLAIAWREPRYDAATTGRPAPAWLDRLTSSLAWRAWWRVFGMLALGYVGWAAVAGPDTLINPFLGVFYVLVWVGIVPLSVFFGPVWKAISPSRTINLLLAKASGSDPAVGIYTYPARLGYWPAALGLFAFVWLELVYPNSTEIGPVRLWCAAYLGIMLIGGALFGNKFYAYADPFEVYSTLASKVSIWGHRDGRLLVRSPLANLDTLTVAPGLVGVVAVLFGSTAFDSFKDSTRWLTFIQGHASLTSSNLANVAANTAAMLAFILAVGGLFALGTLLTAVDPQTPRRGLPTAFAHSIVPIIVGYFVAHYLTYFLEVGQATLIQVSDPLSTGANIFGTGNWSVSYWFSNHQTLLASLKVGAVVLGHVVGVVAAHDRAIGLLPRRHQVTGQLSLLAVMVAFTAGGLYLLFSA